MGDSNDQKDGSAETSDDGSFDQVMNSLTSLKEHRKALDAVLSAKREMDAKAQEEVARVKSQALQVIEAATAVLDRLSLVNGIESLVLKRLCDRPKRADCKVSATRFADGTHAVATLMQRQYDGSQLCGDITRSIRYICDFDYNPYYTYHSHAFMAWGYVAKIQVTQTAGVLGVYLVLHPGPNDSSLSWPFEKVFTLTLVHPTDGSRDVYCRCVPSDTTTIPRHFQRPTDEPNDGYGTGNLCTLGFVKQYGFVVDNKFCISVEILK